MSGAAPARAGRRAQLPLPRRAATQGQGRYGRGRLRNR
ncbi:hypothetical protein Rumeso_02210 [Rubellimicrobium mesophilum DSM 19309]|uniref:Uncharacterized protein n=1 Tax=Rubellimicrobium mesophilum DSM 19309 TaxID=442562 RepID=A0A017HPW9_9RHOB|nr:hypothetical protein Rumeso_02210 [Rubellimicrobium mesophilum DSM 19309]